MVVAMFLQELLEGWTKLGVFALILVFFFGFLFSLMKFSEWKGKARKHRPRIVGLNRRQRRSEQARKGKRRSR